MVDYSFEDELVLLMPRGANWECCKTRWLPYALILMAAFGCRAVAANIWHRQAIQESRVFRLGDSDTYWVLAQQIARGESYEYGSSNARIFRTPVYPMVLAPFTLISEKQSAVWCARLFGCLLGVLAVALVMRLAFQFGGHRAAVASGVLAALYPGAIGMSIVILSEAVFCPLMLTFLLLWMKAVKLAAPTLFVTELAPLPESTHRSLFGSDLRIASAAGLALGLAILSRPSWLLFLPFASAIFVAFFPLRGKQIRILSAIGIAAALTMSPWWIRNACITGRFVPTTLQVGPSLYDGLHAGASGASDENMEFVKKFMEEIQVEDAADAAFGEVHDHEHVADSTATSSSRAVAQTRRSPSRAKDTFEYRMNARMTEAALQWTRENPAGAFWLSLVKLSRTWSLWPQAGEMGSTALRSVLTAGCLVILGLAGWATWKGMVASRWIVVMCWLPAIYFTLLHMVFVGSIRYREPAVLVLIALAGVAWSRAQTPYETKMNETGI